MRLGDVLLEHHPLHPPLIPATDLNTLQVTGPHQGGGPTGRNVQFLADLGKRQELGPSGVVIRAFLQRFGRAAPGRISPIGRPTSTAVTPYPLTPIPRQALAAWYCATMSEATRPRGEIEIPCPTAHSRIAAGLAPDRPEDRREPGFTAALGLTRRPCSINSVKALRRAAAFFLLRSISKIDPSRPECHRLGCLADVEIINH